MSEIRRKLRSKLYDNKELDLLLLLELVRDELAPKSQPVVSGVNAAQPMQGSVWVGTTQPAPAKCEDPRCVCGHPFSRHIHGSGSCVECGDMRCDEAQSLPAQPSPSAKGAAEGMPHKEITLYTLDGDAWEWCMPGYALAAPFKSAVTFIRADMVEKRVARARGEGAEESRATILELNRRLGEALKVAGGDGTIATLLENREQELRELRESVEKRVAEERLMAMADATKRAESAERELGEARAVLESRDEAIRGMSVMLAELGRQSVALNATAFELRSAYAEATKLEVKP